MRVTKPKANTLNICCDVFVHNPFSHEFKFVLHIVFIFIFIYLQANEQDIKISIKQTQSQYSMPHGRRRVVTPLTRDQKITIQINIYTITLETLRTRRKAVQLIKPLQ